MDRFDVSIIIVNYNTGQLTINCINSIREKTSGVSYEIIVVDNASEDKSSQIIRATFKDVTLIENQSNIGFGAANNMGAGLAAGKYLLMLNPDTIFINNALKVIYDFMEIPENRNIAVCGGMLLDGDGLPTVSCGDFPSLKKMVFYSLPFTNKIFRRSELKRLGNSQSKYLITDFVTGADFFIRKDIFKEEGGFDEKYLAYYEDTDLCKRLSLKGYKSAIVREAKIIHLCGKSVANPIKRRMIMYESSLLFLSKFYGHRPSFKLYCVVNQIKYRVYLVLLKQRYTSEERIMLGKMIRTSANYRREGRP